MDRNTGRTRPRGQTLRAGGNSRLEPYQRLVSSPAASLGARAVPSGSRADFSTAKGRGAESYPPLQAARSHRDEGHVTQQHGGDGLEHRDRPAGSWPERGLCCSASKPTGPFEATISAPLSHGLAFDIGDSRRWGEGFALKPRAGSEYQEGKKVGLSAVLRLAIR